MPSGCVHRALQQLRGKLQLLPGADGALAGAVLGLGSDDDVFACATFQLQLPPGTYAFALAPPVHDGNKLALGWAMGAYAFTVNPFRD